MCHHLRDLLTYLLTYPWLGLPPKQHTQGDTSGALSALEAAITINPRAGSAYSELGKLHHSTGDVVAAATAYRAAVEITPDSAEAHLDLAESLIWWDVEAAMNSYRAAVEMSPTSAHAYYQLGEALYHQVASDLGQLTIPGPNPLPSRAHAHTCCCGAFQAGHSTLMLPPTPPSLPPHATSIPLVRLHLRPTSAAGGCTWGHLRLPGSPHAQPSGWRGPHQAGSNLCVARPSRGRDDRLPSRHRSQSA